MLHFQSPTMKTLPLSASQQQYVPAALLESVPAVSPVPVVITPDVLDLNDLVLVLVLHVLVAAYNNNRLFWFWLRV